MGALIAACATTPAAEPEPATTTVASTQLDVASLMPRPARQRMAAAVTANRACEACHEREAASWRGSLHQRANVDDAYRAAFAREPLPFCRACHAPEAIATEEPPADVSAR